MNVGVFEPRGEKDKAGEDDRIILGGRLCILGNDMSSRLS